MSYSEEDKNKQLVLLAASPTEYGANKISGSFAGYDKNQPSDVVSATPSVFPRCIWLHNCAVSFTSFRCLQHDLWFCNFPQPGAYEHLALGPPPHHSGRPGKLFCVRRKKASWCSQRHENDRGLSPIETQSTVISRAINPLPHLSVDPCAKEEDLKERADGMSQKMGWKSKCVFILGDCFNLSDKSADIPPKLTSAVHLRLKITESDGSLGLIALLLFLPSTVTDRTCVMHCR